MSLASLEYRLSMLTALLEVVEALRSLTAARQQKASALLPSAAAYAAATGQALAVLAPIVASSQPVVQLLLGPEGGFTGGLCGRLAAAVPAEWKPLVAGRRTATAMRGRNKPMDAALPVPGAVDTLPALALRLAVMLPRGAAITVLHPLGHRIVRTDLPAMPDRAGRHDLLTQLPGGTLVAAAALQNRQARLLELLLLTHIAELMARLATLTGARERILDHIEALNVEISTVRQEGISQEIADLWAGRSTLHN